MNQLIRKARHISSGSSLAYNEPVKNFKLDEIEKGIINCTKGIQLTDEQATLRNQILKNIDQLKSLNGNTFSSKSVGFSGQVEVLVNSMEQNI